MSNKKKKKKNNTEISKVTKENKKNAEKEMLEKTLQGLKEESEVNPDLESFFEKVREKKEEMEKEDKTIEEVIKPQKSEKKTSKFKYFLTFICILATIIYYVFYIKNSFNTIEYMKNIINASIILITIIFMTLGLISNKKTRNILSYLSSFLIIVFVSFNLLSIKDIIKLPKLDVLKDLTNISLLDAMNYIDKFKINLNTIYEYSDNIPEGYIIMQDIKSGTLLKKVKDLNLTISSGPNYDKELIISNFIGRTLDELLEYIDVNHLNNVTLNFTTNDNVEKDIITDQSIKGEIKRNTSITFTISLGNKQGLKEITLEDLNNKSTFDATLYLKRNAIKYELSYDYSDTIKKDHVISHDPVKGKKVKPNSDVVKLVISKGKKIIVPDFSKANVDDVVNWIVENNLKIAFKEKYSTTIEKDKLLEVSVKKDDVISEGTKITITTSLGSLTIPKFNSLPEFKSWASENNIGYDEKYEYSDSVAKGNIISLSKKTGDKIDPAKDRLTVTISYGKAVTVPNFVGKSKSNILNTCYSVGLNCTFYYVGYNNLAYDTATTQNVASGRKVVSGTYVNIGLSSGPAKTYTIYIQSEWYSQSGSADNTINILRQKLNAAAPGVNFNFIKKSSNSLPPGFIHPDSPVKGPHGVNVTQGHTYTIWVTQ